MNPTTSITNTTPPVTPQAGGVGGFRWRGFRQSRPVVSLIESLLADATQLLSLARSLYPFRGDPATLLTTAPTPPYSAVAQIESLRMQLAFRMSDPTDS